uniref:Immunoglobulin V-set domain-containing protein n=1 Tax=Cyprinus carpio TaxID=7962 RepID=A0A8C2BZ62_CYPCA
MVMSVRMAPPLPLIFLLVIHGVSSADWGVSYGPSHICALKDSSVIMSCNYTYPTEYQIRKVFWTRNPVKVGEEYPDLSEDPEHSQRLQYLGDKQKNCTIRLSHVTQKDSHEYYFSVIADKPDLSSLIKYFTTAEDNVKWIGAPGVSLTVTGDFEVSHFFCALWRKKKRRHDIQPSMVSHTQNSCTAFRNSCNLTHSGERTHARTHARTHTHREHTPGAVGSHLCGEQLGVRCLAQGHLSRGIAGLRLEPTTLGLGVKLSNH